MGDRDQYHLETRPELWRHLPRADVIRLVYWTDKSPYNVNKTKILIWKEANFGIFLLACSTKCLQSCGTTTALCGESYIAFPIANSMWGHQSVSRWRWNDVTRAGGRVLAWLSLPGQILLPLGSAGASVRATNRLDIGLATFPSIVFRRAEERRTLEIFISKMSIVSPVDHSGALKREAHIIWTLPPARLKRDLPVVSFTYFPRRTRMITPV